MRRAGSARGWFGAVGSVATVSARVNDALVDSGIATLERATSMDRRGNLEGIQVAAHFILLVGMI